MDLYPRGFEPHFWYNKSGFMIALVAQTVNRLPTMREAWIQFLGQEDSPGEGNGNQFQYSCLDSPMNRGAW